MKKITALILCILSIVWIFPAYASYTNNQYIPSPKWEVSASSDLNNTVGAIIDMNDFSYWHSKYTVADGKIVAKENQPFILTVKFPVAKNISGVEYLPRQRTDKDTSRSGIALSVSIFYSQNGTDFIHITDDTFSYIGDDRSSKITMFSSVTAKAIQYVINEGQDGFGTCAELSFIKSNPDDPDDNDAGQIDIDKEKEILMSPISPKGETASDAYEYSTGWKITVNSAFEQPGIGNMFDRDKSTYWHSWYNFKDGKITEKDTPPYVITTVFPYAKAISGIRYTPRQDIKSSTAGIATDVEVWGSTDGEKYSKLASDKYTYGNGFTDRSPHTTTFAEDEYKALRFVIIVGISGYGTCAELEFIKGSKNINLSNGENKRVEPKEAVTIFENTIKASSPSLTGNAAADTIPYSNSWVIEANTAMDSGNLSNLFDRNGSTTWHSFYKAEGSTVTEHVTPPYDFFVTFSEPTTISGIRYTPRQDLRTTGIAEKGEVYGSMDGIKFVKLGDGIFDNGADKKNNVPKSIKFDDVTLKTVCFRVTETVGMSHGTGAEIEVLKGDSKKAVIVTDYMQTDMRQMGKIVLTIDKSEANIDGETITLNTPAVISNDYTLVPIRFVSEALGAAIGWNEKTRTVSITSGDLKIVLVINSNKASVNGKNYLLSVPAQLMNNSTMVPLRFVSEAMGAKVEWKAETRQVEIYYKKSIALWGDGLAAGAGSLTESPEKSLYAVTGGIPVKAYGSENENAVTVAARQGAYKILLASPVTIPPTGGTFIDLVLDNGKSITPRSGLGGWNECIIGGITGTLTFDIDYTVSPRTLRSVRFIRKASGEAINLSAGTEVTTLASADRSNINIFMLSNHILNRESPEELVAVLKDMINATSNKTQYIVVGPIEGTKEELAAVEAAYSDAFGDKFLNAREYFVSEEALRCYDIMHTEDLDADIAEGKIPLDFLKGKNDRGALNDRGYGALAELLHNKMISLGYIDK